MMKRRSFWVMALFLMSFTSAIAQVPASPDSTKRVVQVSGMTIDADSLFPIPFVAVVIKGTSRGVYSTGTGYFSIVAQETDTLEFFSLGYKTSTFILKDTFTVSQMNLVQTLKMDTVLLSEMVVYPWPSREKFKSAFLALDIPNDDLERARINLAQQRMIAAATNVSADGQGAYRAQMQQRTDKSYYAGQYQPNNLLNPVAWSKFIQSMRKQ
ncbi:MAG: carboxypeptidase-like regulatory domain-containing protein [Bacteroidia bacterium]|nr:carboxypeptidase-like regulatory domain-containing protein [Bacteroidia bacterium]